MGESTSISLPKPYWTYQGLAVVSLLPAVGALVLGEFFPRAEGSIYFSLFGFLIVAVVMMVNIYTVGCFKHGKIPRIAKDYITRNTPPQTVHRYLRNSLLFELGFTWVVLAPLNYHPIPSVIEVFTMILFLYAQFTMPGRLIKTPTKTED